MSKDIVKQDIKALLDAWIKAEQEGCQFPVPFDMAWRIAEYSTKASAKRYLPKRSQGGFFNVRDIKSKVGKGRPTQEINLSVDCFKHLCMMANTDIGYAVRQYMIERDKTLAVVEQIAPEVYSEAQLIKDKIELAKLQAQVAQSQLALRQFNHYVTTSLPEATQQKILGYNTVEKIEYRDRIYHDDELLNDGSTVTKGELSRRYGLSSKKLASYIKQLPPEAFDDSVYVRRCEQVKREWVPELDRIIDGSTRQAWLGE